MGILERPRLISQQRFNLEDWGAHLSNLRTDSNYHIKRLISSGNLIVKGFSLSGLGSNSATLAMSEATLLFSTNTSDFSWYTAEAGISDITITDAELVDNTRNYIEIYLTESDGTPVTNAFRDPTGNGGLGVEFQQETNTITSLTVNVAVTTGGFSGSADRIPIGIIDTNASGVIKIINDKRNLFGRLGTNSDPSNEFSFATQEEPILTLALTGGSGTYVAGEIVTFSTGATAIVATGGTTSITIKEINNDSYATADTLTGSTSGAARTVDTMIHSYTGGDLDIVTEKDRFDAVTTLIKQISGSDFWYKELDYLNANAKAIKHIHSIAGVAASSVTTGDYYLLNAANNVNRYYVWSNKDAGGGDPKVPGRVGIEATVTTGQTAAQVTDAHATAINAISDFSAPTTGTGTILVTNADFGVCDGLIERNSGFTLTADTAGVGEILHNITDAEGLIKTGKNLDEAVFVAKQKVDNHTNILKMSAKDTPDQSIDIAGSFVVLPDQKTLSQTFNSRVLNFIGCNINFNTGTILDSNGGALGTNFTPATIAADKYRWYAITAILNSINSDNTTGIVITVTAASADGDTLELAPKATWPSSGTPIGQIVVQDNGSGGAGTIENIDDANLYQLSAGSGGGGSGAGSIYQIEETSHGFTALDCVYFNGVSGAWEKADTTADSKAAIYCVLEVIDTNTFNAVRQGRFTVTGHGKTVGEYYYLSASAGVASATSPSPSTDNFFQLIFHVEDANTINFLVSIPSIIQSTLLIDPMTTNGDMIIQSGGTSTRLPIGASNSVLYSNGSLPSWLTIKDEDDMASDSATDICTQQSIKAYIDKVPFIEYINTSGSPTLVSGANTVIDYNYAIHTDTSYFTVTTGASWNAKVLQNGLYLILASINITANATGARVFNLTAGGVVEDVDARPGTATTNHTLKTAVMVKLSTNDTIYTDLFQNSGSNLFNVTPNQASKIVIARIGD